MAPGNDMLCAFRGGRDGRGAGYGGWEGGGEEGEGKWTSVLCSPYVY